MCGPMCVWLLQHCCRLSLLQACGLAPARRAFFAALVGAAAAGSKRTAPWGAAHRLCTPNNSVRATLLHRLQASTRSHARHTLAAGAWCPWHMPPPLARVMPSHASSRRLPARLVSKACCVWHPVRGSRRDAAALSLLCAGERGEQIAWRRQRGRGATHRAARRLCPPAAGGVAVCVARGGDV